MCDHCSEFQLLLHRVDTHENGNIGMCHQSSIKHLSLKGTDFRIAKFVILTFFRILPIAF